MSSVLVIGFGNELRRDDGLGPKIAGCLESQGRLGLQVLTCHQLTPELAETLSTAPAVVFFDAAVGRPDVQVQPLLAAPAAEFRTHHLEPAALLALTQSVFGRCPRAWWITVPAFDLSFGEGLSERAQAGMKAALEAFDRLWNEELAPNP